MTTPASASVSDPALDPRVERQTRAFLETLNASGGKPMETLPPNEAREVLVAAQASVSVALPACEVSQKLIVQDDLSVGITIVRPAGVAGDLAGFLFFHGGGWVLGDFPTHERFVRDLVVGSGCAAVFVNYTPSPEAQYPTAIHEAYAATQWVASNGHEIGVDGSRLAVVGNSVGGNMATVVALMAKEKGGPNIKCQILFWPVTNANFETDSYNEYANGYFLTKAMMKWFWDNYTVDPEKRHDIHTSPLQATSEQLAGLPPALILTAGNDVLRDEGEAYARNLDAAGVEVTLVRYSGMIHDFGLLNALSEIPTVRMALHQAAEELKRRLA